MGQGEGRVGGGGGGGGLRGRTFLITSNDQSAKPASPVLGSVQDEMLPSEKSTTKTPQRCASSELRRPSSLASVQSAAAAAAHSLASPSER